MEEEIKRLVVNISLESSDGRVYWQDQCMVRLLVVVQLLMAIA
jgi:hypothetical protein